MKQIKLPKYVLPISFMGTVIGSVALFKDYMDGKNYTGEEKCIGKTIIITGCNTGIGKETARELARRGGKIIMACRDLEKCEKARAEIVLETANRNVHCRKCDLGSIASVRAFAQTVSQSEKHIDILINNAGIMRCPKTLTEDGFEMQLGVNHFGHFLLTNMLLDKLKTSGPSRIINVSSLAHYKGEINFEDLNSAKHYDKSAAYSQSKLANVLFTRELSKRLEGSGVTVNALHPGLVKTDIGRHMSITQSYISSFLLAPIFWITLKSPFKGCQTTLYCALSPELEGISGKYFSDLREKPAAKQALDDITAKRLWAISEKWTRLS